MKIKNDAYAFISYSSRNRPEAELLYNTLANNFHRVTCWLDIEDIEHKEFGFPEQILQGILNSSCLIFVETAEAKEANYVDLELQNAIQKNKPIIRYKVKSTQSKRVNLIRMFFLALQVKFRITQPYWISLTLMSFLLSIMAVAIFFFGAKITPTLVQAANRVLPDVVHIEEPVDYEELIPAAVAAPFHYVPDYALLLDDFDNEGGLNRDVYYYDIENQSVEESVSNGIYHVMVPKSCSINIDNNSCSIEIHSQIYPLETIQYFAFRARVDGINTNQNLSLSISPSSWDRTRIGFGWNLSSNATAYFRAFQALPEEDYFADVKVDNQWHAYEILLNPQSGELDFYMDGQLIGNHSMQHYEEWKSAPLHLIIFTSISQFPKMNTSEVIDSNYEIDQLIIGGFNQNIE